VFEQSELLSSDELIPTITLNYCLDETIVDRIEIYTTTFIGDNGNIRDVRLDYMSNILVQQIILDRNKSLPQVTITINDVYIRIRHRAGDTFARDASCNSEYMTEAMARVDATMRSKYYWVPMNIPLYLVLNNAGGQGTNECIKITSLH